MDKKTGIIEEVIPVFVHFLYRSLGRVNCDVESAANNKSFSEK